jgi:hypothetical protein
MELSSRALLAGLLLIYRQEGIKYFLFSTLFSLLPGVGADYLLHD